jgi:hypothetical protein
VFLGSNPIAERSRACSLSLLGRIAVRRRLCPVLPRRAQKNNMHQSLVRKVSAVEMADEILRGTKLARGDLSDAYML